VLELVAVGLTTREIASLIDSAGGDTGVGDVLDISFVGEPRLPSLQGAPATLSPSTPLTTLLFLQQDAIWQAGPPGN
jgi:hypothetical protein